MGKFKKGVSGNPKGKPKGIKNKVYAKNLADIAEKCREVFDEKEGISFDEYIVNEYLSFVERTLLDSRISADVLNVKNKILKDYLDRLHGKAAQKIEAEATLLNGASIKVEFDEDNKSRV